MQCHRAVPRLSSRRNSDADPFGAIDFALFGPAGPASDTLTYKKDSSQHKESEKMEPSGLEPLTPCMPCRCSTS